MTSNKKEGEEEFLFSSFEARGLLERKDEGETFRARRQKGKGRLKTKVGS